MSDLVRLGPVTDCPIWWQILASQHGRLVFDIGANTGQAAALFAPNFDRVVSFEPCDESYQILTAEAAPNVTAYLAAVSSTVGRLQLDETHRSIRTGQLTTGSRLNWGRVVGHRNVNATTIDAAVDMLGAPDVVKVDTEGHEVHVLRGAPNLIASRAATWLIEVHAAEHEEPIRDLLDGYRIQRYAHTGHPGDDLFYLEAKP